ncbi:hypothetical protein G6011_03999 [Alternaria panax]|uniref:Cytochrome P450 monooxygenase n=1 Tax=Alternaria panax TaxID=48097 RepID=A0AAD4IGA9_9PLEO|nr:hypothetical protein G6011_03999 [Alternaria panax]
MARALQAMVAKATVFNLTSPRGIALLLGAFLAVYALKSVIRIIYNVYWHPLAKYPGPKIWIALGFTRALGHMRGDFDLRMAEEHRKHGEVVRISVNGLSFINPAAWKDIYGHGHKELRKHFPPNSVNPNQIIAADSSNHFRMRRAMLPAFSEKALAQQERLVRVYLDLLVQRLGECATTSGTADMARWYNLTTFDLIADLCFGKSLDGLETGKSNAWIEKIDQMLKMMPVLTLVTSFPLLMSLFKLTFGKKMQQSRKQHQEYAASLAMSRIKGKEQADRGDFMDFILRSRGEEHELSDEELVHNADLLMVAGSETTATILLGVTYYLLRNPACYKKVTEEVRGAFGTAEEIAFKEVNARCPYMLACLNEAMRIFPSIPLALLRVTSEGAPTPVAGHLIPPETNVGVHQLAAYHSPLNFHDPLSFYPERWLPEVYNDPSSPFHDDRRDVHKPFSYGRRDCIGRNLAFLEMRLIVALLLWNFDLELAEGMGGWEKQRIFGLWEKPPLKVNIQQRKR